MKNPFRAITGRLAARYRKMSIHMVISLAFTGVALMGILFLGMSLFGGFLPPRKGLWRKTASVSFPRSI